MDGRFREDRKKTYRGGTERVSADDRSLLRWVHKLNYSIRKWITDWITTKSAPPAAAL